MKTYDFILTSCDTDSIAFSKADMSFISPAEREALIEDLNSQFPDKIKFSDDGYYDTVVVLKAKNYILKTYLCKKCKKTQLLTCTHESAKLTKKGSSLKSSKIEPALKEFMGEIIDCLLNNQLENIIEVYHKYVKGVHHLTDITSWCSKKTITEAVLNPGRTTEEKILDSLNGRPVQMGDKIYVYFAEEKQIIKIPRYKSDRKTKEKIFIGEVEKEVVATPLRLREDWKGDHHVDSLLRKLYNTLVIFENVIDITQFPKYFNKGKEVKEKLRQILND